MEFIQFTEEPSDGIPDTDGYCIALKVKVPESHRNYEFRDDLYKCRPHEYSEQNQGIGWWCERAKKTSFKLILKY